MKKTLSESQKKELLLKRIRQIIREEIEREELSEISLSGVGRGIKRFLGLGGGEDVNKTQPVDMRRVRFNSYHIDLPQNWTFLEDGLLRNQELDVNGLDRDLKNRQDQIKAFQEDLKSKGVSYDDTRTLNTVHNIFGNFRQIFGLMKNKRWNFLNSILNDVNLSYMKPNFLKYLTGIIKVSEKIRDIRMFKLEDLKRELVKLFTYIQNDFSVGTLKGSSEVELDNMERQVGSLLSGLKGEITKHEVKRSKKKLVRA